ncbi:MAG: hypothetical protein ACOZIN_12975 [Myxococcota bacterium]
MRILAASVALVLWTAPALAQKEHFFGTGKPPVFREEDTDRRFAKSKIARALKGGVNDPHCVQLIGGLLTALAEVAPLLHRRDENFTLDPVLLHAVNTQLTYPRFPGNAYFALMVRRVLIDKALPAEWLATAEALNPKVQIIDLGKLRFLHEGWQPIDSFYFTLPALRERYDHEVVRANSAVTSDVVAQFRDTYLDRDVAWGGVTLVDIGEEVAAKKTKGKKAPPRDVSEQKLVAILQWQPPSASQHQLMVFAEKKPPPVKIIAKLSAKQFVDLERLPKGKRLLVRGRFWEMNRKVSEVELRDALLFEDRDWSQGVLLADPQAVAACPIAVNELSGVAPVQPGGFGHRLGGG